MIRNRTHEIEETVRKNIACVEEENPVSLFMKNLQSEILREVLDLAVQQLKVVAKELLTTFRGKVYYLVKASLRYIMKILNCDDWTELLMVDGNESLLLTNYLKNNKDGLRNFVILKLKSSYFEALQKNIVLLIQDGNHFVYSQAKVQAEILKPLWKQISLTPKETEIDQTLVKEIGDTMNCFVCKLSVNCEC